MPLSTIFEQMYNNDFSVQIPFFFQSKTGKKLIIGKKSYHCSHKSKFSYKCFVLHTIVQSEYRYQK